MHDDLQGRVLANQGPGGPGVIEMDVGEQNHVQVTHRETESTQPCLQISHAGGGTGIDKSQPAFAFQQSAGDNLGRAQVLDVDEGCLGGDF